MTISVLHRHDTHAPEPDDVNDVLDADDVAAELLGDADEPPTTAMPRRGTNPTRSDLRALGTHSPSPAASLPPSAAAANSSSPAARLPPSAAAANPPCPATPMPPSTAAANPPCPVTPMPPSAAALPTLTSRLEQAEVELIRLRRHMRARDAYLAELERALLASTTQLEASKISSIEDAHKLFGRLRGQAFRIAELESELRGMEVRVSRLSRLVPNGLVD